MYLSISMYLYLVIILNTVLHISTPDQTTFHCCCKHFFFLIGKWVLAVDLKFVHFLISNFPRMQMKFSVVSGIKWYERMFATVEKALFVRPGNSKLCRWCDFNNSCMKMIGECNVCIIVLSAELYWWKLMPYLFSQ